MTEIKKNKNGKCLVISVFILPDASDEQSAKNIRGLSHHGVKQF